MAVKKLLVVKTKGLNYSSQYNLPMACVRMRGLFIHDNSMTSNIISLFTNNFSDSARHSATLAVMQQLIMLTISFILVADPISSPVTSVHTYICHIRAHTRTLVTCAHLHSSHVLTPMLNTRTSDTILTLKFTSTAGLRH